MPSLNWTEQDLEAAKQRMWGQRTVDTSVVRGSVEEHVRGLRRAPVYNGSCESGRLPVANPAPSPYRSKLDAAFATKLELELKAGFVKAWRYEPMSFKLANGKRYRPDFMIQYPDELERHVEFIEVKGHHANLRDSLTHLAWAAQRYPMFVWKLVKRINGHWEERQIT